MSVWNNLLPSYKGEIVWRLSKDIQAELFKRHLGFFDYEIKGSDKLFPGLVNGNRKDLIYGNQDFPTDFQECFQTDLYIYHLLNRSKNWKAGIKGCYSFYKELHLDRKIVPLDKTPQVSELASNVFKAMTINSHFNTKDTFKFAEEMVDQKCFDDTHLRISNMLKAIKSLRNLHSIKKANRDISLDGPTVKGSKVHKVTKQTDSNLINYAEIPERMYASVSKYNVIFYKGIYYFIALAVNDNSYAFTNKDMSRVINFADALSGAFFHANYKNNIKGEPFEQLALRTFLKYLYDSADLNKATEAWVSALKAVKCILAGPLAMEGFKSLVQERIEKGHESLCKLDTIKALLTGKSSSDICVLAAVARIAMPPDYDVAKCFTDEKELHLNKNTVGAEINKDAEDIYTGFLKYNRYAFINQYAKRYKIMPGSAKDATTTFGQKYTEAVINRKRIKISLQEAEQVDLRGVLKYKDRDDDYFMYFKDTSMARETVSENLSDDYNKFEEANQIGHLLKAPERLEVSTYKTQFNNDDVEHPIRVGLKVESAKEDGRLFFIYNLKDKILKSEIEENIHEFLRFVPGNAVGKSSVDLKKTMLDVIQMDPTSGVTPVFLSDDISKWSPHMPTRVQKDSAVFWAEVFDQPWIADIESIDLNDTVIMNIMGYRATYHSNGANKEGASGKRFTYLMINLKAYATYILRGKSGREKVMDGAVRLLTFLDDGFIQADVNSKTYKTSALKLIDGYRYIQRCCGYELKIAKSYPSDRYLTFLNYEYAARARLYDELKSCVKLFVKKPGEVMTLPERLREAASWAVGAAESGTDVGFVYYAYVFRAVYEVQSWSRKSISCNITNICQFATPIPYGGFGLSPVHGIIAGLVRNATAEGLETLKRIATHYAEARPIYALIVKSVITPKRGLTIIRTPATIVSACPHLTEHRIVNALERTFLDNNESPYLQEFIKHSSSDDLEAFGDKIVYGNQKIAYTTLELVYKSTTISFIERVLSKCKKSASLIDLLGAKVLNKITHANIAEAQRVIDEWVYRISNNN